MAYLGPIDLTQIKTDIKEVVPEGIYSGMIVKTDVLDTKKKDGKFIYLEIQISDGQFAGTIIEDRLNVMNPSEKAQNIGLAALKRLCDALGIQSFDGHTEVFENKLLKLKVSVEAPVPYTDKYGQEKPGFPSNSVKGYYTFTYDEGQSSSIPTVNQTQGQAQAKAPFPVRQ